MSKWKKNVRIKKWMPKYLLAEGPKTTLQVVTAFNEAYKHGTRNQTVGELLAKHPDIVKVGIIRIRNAGGDLRDVTQWNHKDNVEGDTDE